MTTAIAEECCKVVQDVPPTDGRPEEHRLRSGPRDLGHHALLPDLPPKASSAQSTPECAELFPGAGTAADRAVPLRCAGHAPSLTAKIEVTQSLAELEGLELGCSWTGHRLTTDELHVLARRREQLQKGSR